MKKITSILESKAKKIDVKDSVCFLKKADLEKYLDVAKNCLSVESKAIIDYLIKNNDSYMSLSEDDENPIVGFYNAGLANASDKDLWKLIDAVVKSGRILEIPTLQNEKEFKDIINGNLPADYVILQLNTEKGRNAVPKQYDNLIYKIIGQWQGKSTFGQDDLKSMAYEGIVYAMQTYGKRSKKTKGEDVTKLTFGQYAAWCIRNTILENIKQLSHVVRIPISQQQKEKESTGKNTKSNAVSGDKVVGHGEDGSKTLFDFMGMTDDTGRGVDDADVRKLWDEIYKLLDDEFDKKTMDIFYAFNGLRDYEGKPVPNKELAQKYGCKPSQITYYCYRVKDFMAKDKRVKDRLIEVRELMNECQAERDRDDNNGPIYVHVTEKNTLDED